MKTIYQKALLAFSQAEYWVAQRTGNLDLEHMAMQNRAILQTQLRVAQEKDKNNNLFININK